MYLFNEKYTERYIDSVCTSDSMQFDNLPVIDGNRFSGHGVRAGIYPMIGDNVFTFDEVLYTEVNGNVTVYFKGANNITITLCETNIRINAEDVRFVFKYDNICDAHVSDNTMFMKYNDFVTF